MSVALKATVPLIKVHSCTGHAQGVNLENKHMSASRPCRNKTIKNYRILNSKGLEMAAKAQENDFVSDDLVGEEELMESEVDSDESEIEESDSELGSELEDRDMEVGELEIEAETALCENLDSKVVEAAKKGNIGSLRSILKQRNEECKKLKVEM